jgi:hypothetical protein
MASPVLTDQDHESAARILNLPEPIADAEPVRKIDLEARPGRNILTNGDFGIAQRGATFTSTGGGNSDATYNYDRWYLLSDGNDIVDLAIIALTAVDRTTRGMRFDVETANKKFGIAQIIEYEDIYPIRNQPLTLSFLAAFTNVGTLDHVKCAVIGWTGATDAPTRDFVSAWNADDTQPTLAANWTYLTTPVDLNVDSTVRKYSVTMAATNSYFNRAVFIWADCTTGSVGNYLAIGDVQLEPGSLATAFDYVPHRLQLARCQPFYEVLRYDDANIQVVGLFYSSPYYAVYWQFKAAKRIKPTVTLVTGSWVGGAPVFYEGVDSVYLQRAGSFYASGTEGNVALAASADF